MNKESISFLPDTRQLAIQDALHQMAMRIVPRHLLPPEAQSEALEHKKLNTMALCALENPYVLHYWLTRLGREVKTRINPCKELELSHTTEISPGLQLSCFKTEQRTNFFGLTIPKSYKKLVLPAEEIFGNVGSQPLRFYRRVVEIFPKKPFVLFPVGFLTEASYFPVYTSGGSTREKGSGVIIAGRVIGPMAEINPSSSTNYPIPAVLTTDCEGRTSLLSEEDGVRQLFDQTEDFFPPLYSACQTQGMIDETIFDHSHPELTPDATSNWTMLTHGGDGGLSVFCSHLYANIPLSLRLKAVNQQVGLDSRLALQTAGTVSCTLIHQPDGQVSFLGAYPPWAHQVGQYGLAIQTEELPETIMAKLK